MVSPGGRNARLLAAGEGVAPHAAEARPVPHRRRADGVLGARRIGTAGVLEEGPGLRLQHAAVDGEDLRVGVELLGARQLAKKAGHVLVHQPDDGPPDDALPVALLRRLVELPARRLDRQRLPLEPAGQVRLLPGLEHDRGAPRGPRRRRHQEALLGQGPREAHPLREGGTPHVGIGERLHARRSARVPGVERSPRGRAAAEDEEEQKERAHAPHPTTLRRGFHRRGGDDRQNRSRRPRGTACRRAAGGGGGRARQPASG
jgi:hypothetical protein